MIFTVAICTWNRSGLLTKTLDNMLNLNLNESFSWELLVVNNNCTDDTDKVIDSFIDKLPLRRIFEPTLGLSNARNTAVRNANGDFIVWTDDDVLVDNNWLIAYCEAFRKWPDAAVFGGPVTPWFEGAPPEWLIKGWHHISNSFATRDLGSQPVLLNREKGLIPFGANFAVRIKEQSENLFDPKLGLLGNEKILGEEVGVMANILKIPGVSGRWVPDAAVKHWIPKERQTLKFIRNYHEGYGRTLVRIQCDVLAAKIFGKPRWLIRKVIELKIVYFFQRIFKGPEVWVKGLTEVSTYRGMLKEYR